jgi:hypothetical protein
VNVTQQVGAALGLAVLVSVLSAAAGHAQLNGTAVPTHMVHGLDVTFAVAALFGIAALVMVALLVHLPGVERAGAPASRSDEAEVERAREAAGAEFELVDGEGFEWSGPELVA